MLLSEHAITLPAFNFTQFGSLAEWAFLFGLGLNQLIVNGGVRLAQNARERFFGQTSRSLRDYWRIHRSCQKTALSTVHKWNP